MTLKEIIKAHPDLFYRQQWYLGEAFMDRIVARDALVPPKGARAVRGSSVSAGELAAAYVRDPKNPVWKNYLWTSDTDSLGQRVYVGDNGQGLEIHRHIHLTKRFGYPIW